MDDSQQNLLKQAARVLTDPNATMAQREQAHSTVVAHIRSCAPQRAGADYRIMQYNILRDGDGWGWAYLSEPSLGCAQRIEPLCAVMEGYRPHVIGVSERYDCWEDDAHLTERFKALGYAVLENALPEEMRRTWHYGYPDSDFNRNPLFYDFRRFEVVCSEIANVMAFPSINYRGLTCAILRDLQTDGELAVFVTHWESCGINKEGVEPKTPGECRMVNAQRMCAKMQAFLAGREGVPVVVMGDFNTFPTDEAYQFLIQDQMLQEFSDATNRIDHILTKHCEVLAEAVDTAPYTGYTSDHKPLYCDVSV